ncbi:hypothetical protein [Brevundimonas sp.]|uniref:hypothetical protein n=1 Tax=Brevundimonas sp. TaxID=1871086 RepID=UPI003D1173CC
MISKIWAGAACAGALALAALGLTAPAASAQTASLYSSAVSQPTDLIVLSDGGPAYVSSNTGVYYLPTPGGTPVLVSGVRQYRELTRMADGSLLAASASNGNIYRLNAGCTTLAGCAETLFASIGGGSGAYGVAVDNVNSHVFFTAYDTGTIRRTDLSGAGMVTFASGLVGPAGLEIGSDGFLYLGDSDNKRVLRYPANCTAPCTTGTVFVSGGTITSTRGVSRSSSGIMFISDGGALGSGKVYTVGPAGGTPVQYSALAVNGIESIYLIDGTNTLYVSGGVGGGSPNTYKISVAAAAAALATAVPTMTEWAMILFAMLMVGGGALIVWRRQASLTA